MMPYSTYPRFDVTVNETFAMDVADCRQYLLDDSRYFELTLGKMVRNTAACATHLDISLKGEGSLSRYPERLPWGASSITMTMRLIRIWIADSLITAILLTYCTWLGKCCYILNYPILGVEVRDDMAEEHNELLLTFLKCVRAPCSA